MVNKGQLHKELRYFQSVLQIWSKWDKELIWEIRDFSNFKNTTLREIHKIKNHSIWIKILEEIKEQKLSRIFEHEEKENKN